MQIVSMPRVRRTSALGAGALRAWHANVSAFIAPTILFFSLSGVMQILGLQDPHGSYAPSALVSSIARLHKQQVFAPEPQHGPPPGAGRRDDGAGRREPAPSPATIALKALFVLEALALAATTLLGTWIGATHPKRARTFRLLLAAGVIVPVALALA